MQYIEFKDIDFDNLGSDDLSISWESGKGYAIYVLDNKKEYPDKYVAKAYMPKSLYNAMANLVAEAKDEALLG